MKNTGTCPKCGSKDIYTDKNLSKRGERCSIAVNSWVKIFVDNYICISCGYFEEYAVKFDEKKLEIIKSEWSRLN
jgi:predicted nucleic-acid-binding Zn-ribbon protein